MIDTRTAPYAATVLRVSLGLPPALAYATFWAELVGGVLLIAGLGSRWVAAALIPVLAGATWVHSRCRSCSRSSATAASRLQIASSVAI